MDDACVLGGNHEEHLGYRKNVLTRFLTNGVSLKLSKCRFTVTRIKYVGHVVQAGEGVLMNPKKVNAMLGMGPSKNTQEVTSVLGAA